MNTIWKFPISYTQGPRFSIGMPAGAQILTLQLQDGMPYLWALVNTTAEKVARAFVIVGTGQEKPNFATRYVGTWQENSFVWHLFEEIS